MIADVNKTIREILLVDGGIDLTEIDISFELPNREWSARISKPTINCYLFDLRERASLREEGWLTEQRAGGRRERRQPPMFMALTYLITAWTSEVEDEHRLLWHALQTLTRYARLPADRFQGELRELEPPYDAVTTEIARADSVLKSPGEFWTALENHLKPSINYTVTVPLSREAFAMGPPVRFSRFVLQIPDSSVAEEQFWIGGVVRDAAGQRVAGVRLVVLDHEVEAVSDELGRYRLVGLEPGAYTLQSSYNSRQFQHTINAPEYTDITLAD